MLHSRTLLTLSFLALPAASEAQPRRPMPDRPGGRGLSATELLNRRRELDLTPRQVARLDSIERAQFAQRRQLGLELQRQRDSLCANRRPCVLSQEERQRFRDQMERERPRREAMLRGDSAARSLAFSMLDSTQRGRVQGMRMRAPMGRGEIGPRFRGQDRGFMGPRRGFARPGEFGPRFNRGQMGPRFNRRGMEPGVAPRERPMGPRLLRERRPGMGGDMGPRLRRMPGDTPERPDSTSPPAR
jgi:hypothetical protein